MKKSLLLTVVMPCLALGALASTANHGALRIRSLTGIEFVKKAETINGTVKDAKGQPLAGVNVLLKGTKIGTSADGNGKFSIQANIGDVLVISYLGYTSKEVTINSKQLNIVLEEDSKQLGEVVVTALGIKKSEKSITYSSQQLSGSELTKVKSDNLMNSLNGKISGVTISPSASGVGGSAKVILRGNKSAGGNNQPLYVIDGVPISNGSNGNGQPTNTFGTNVGQGGAGTTPLSASQDGGDGISNLNPDDIENITVLKGASASALYGSQAQNGVIMITTKKGKAGKTIVNYSSSLTLDQVAYKPKFQDSYGETKAGATDSWGAKVNGAADNVSSFFQTGRNWTNSINLSGGTEAAQTYFSYSNTAARGTQPNNDLSRHNVNLRESAKFFDNKLSLDGNVNYISQTIQNSPGMGLYLNPLTGLYLFPRGRDLSPYKNQFELPAVVGGNGAPVQNWPFDQDVQQNPWWILNRNLNESKRNRILLNASAKYEFTNWLSLQARGSIDRTNDKFEQRLYAGTHAVLAKKNGQLLMSDQTLEQKYADLLLNFSVPGESDLKIDGVLGTSITDSKVVGTRTGPDANNTYTEPGLTIPNIFLPENIATAAGGPPTLTLPNNHSQIQSLFASANFSYKNWAFLTLTGRSDWSSNLAFTPNKSYFYPSAGLSVILNQALTLPEVISYAKIRGTFAQVGNTVPPYVTRPLTHMFIGGGVLLNSVAPFPKLKPEKTNSFELGADLRFLDNKLSFSFTYYRSNTLNQFIQVIPAYTTTFSMGYVNAGDIQNSGIEFNLGYDVIKNSNFNWTTSFNGSANKNKVIDVDSKNGINRFVLTPNRNNNYESVLTTGGSFGDIDGVTFQRDEQGRIKIGADGKPMVNQGFNHIGNPNPKFQLGWSNTFDYKNFSLSFLVDGKFGGQVLSLTEAILDDYGVSKVTGEARDRGSVNINGVNAATGAPISSVDPTLWYTTVGGRDGITENYIYSATVVRLREVSLGYSVPFTKGFVKNLRISLIGRNLLYLHKKAPFDPDVTMSTGNGLSGVDVFSQPATRNIGFNLNVTL